jgi:hypothetical protein
MEDGLYEHEITLTFKSRSNQVKLRITQLTLSNSTMKVYYYNPFCNIVSCHESKSFGYLGLSHMHHVAAADNFSSDSL